MSVEMEKIESISFRFYYSDYFINSINTTILLHVLGFHFFSVEIYKKGVHKYIFTVRWFFFYLQDSFL